MLINTVKETSCIADDTTESTGDRSALQFQEKAFNEFVDGVDAKFECYLKHVLTSWNHYLSPIITVEEVNEMVNQM